MVLRCAIQPAGTTLAVPGEVREWEGPGPRPTDRPAPARRGAVLPRYERVVHNYSVSNGEPKRDNRYRYAEEIIGPGSELFVLGQVEPADTAQSADGAPAAPWRIGPALDSSMLHQPCVVSVLPPAQVQGTFGQLSRGAAVIGGIFLAIAGFLLWARLRGGSTVDDRQTRKTRAGNGRFANAAWVMLEAATTHDHDRQFVGAATVHRPGSFPSEAQHPRG